MAKTEDSDDAVQRPSWGDRVAARVAGVGSTPNAIVVSPEPMWTGDAAAARRLAAGIFLFGGAMIEAWDESPWDQDAPTAAWTDALHGFDWLDDLAATGDAESRRQLKKWVHEWIERYGTGEGPGWRPDLAGRRLANWICHAPVILDGAGTERSRAFFRSIGRQTRFLRRRWKSALEGLPRIQAAAGLVYAGLAQEEAGGAIMREGIGALARECERSVGPDGGAPGRNPEHVVEIFSILVWTKKSLIDAGMEPDPAHEDALLRLAAAIRSLRLGDGTLARFHGGGAGDPERIDRALATSGIRRSERLAKTMDYHRLAGARTVVFFDGGAPPTGPAATTVHASVFCLEASIGRRPVIVSCGPGERFGEDWRMAARSTAAHSGLTIDDMSSTRLGAGGLMTAGAKDITVVREDDIDGARLIAEHDGYLATHGLIHQRRLTLSADGTDLRGEDRVSAVGPGPRAAFEQAAGREDRMEIPFTVRFHLHPDVEADVFLAGGAVRIKPPSGDVWVMRQLGGVLSVEDSVYLDETRIAPRATKQIVVRARASDYAGRVKWAFRRAEPQRPAPRDFAEAEEA